MAQAGLHALVGATVRKLAPTREYLMLGVILGSLFPDLDNYTVAIATIAGRDPAGLHRTFTHSLFTVLTALLVFLLTGMVRRQPRWTNLGIGLAAGIALHILLDLILWFNGVELLWPLGGWINFWEKVTPPAWLSKLLDPLEFAFLAIFLAWLGSTAGSHHTNRDVMPALRIWTIAMIALFVIFTPLAYLLTKGFFTIYGLFYLIALTAAFVLTIRMRRTLDALG
jgi:membrane-bound metal-dependent hydrolase YbcI (DUF457 family)